MSKFISPPYIMSETPDFLNYKSTDDRYPAHRRIARSEMFELYRQTFLKSINTHLSVFHEPRWQIDDGGHRDFLEFIGYPCKEKDGQIHISFTQGFLISIYRHAEQVIGKTEKISDVANMLARWVKFFCILDTDLNVDTKHHFEFFMWMSLWTEVSCYIYEDSLDFHSIGEANIARFFDHFMESPHIKLSMNLIREELRPQGTKNLDRGRFFLLDERQEELLNQVLEQENKDGVSVTAVIKKGKFHKIESRRRAIADELNDLHQLTKEIHHGEIENMKIVDGNKVAGILMQKIDFDKERYISRNELLSKNG